MAVALPTFLMYWTERTDQWTATVSNTGEAYYFTSKDAAIQLARAMRVGKQEAIDLIDQGEIFTQRFEGEYMFDALFNSTRSATLGADGAVFYNDATTTIAEDLLTFSNAWEAVLIVGSIRLKVNPKWTLPASKKQNGVGSPPSGSFGITFTNMSATNYDLAQLLPPLDGGFVTINTQPSNVLSANGGVESLAWTETCPNWTIGGYEADVQWMTANFTFGVMIKVPFQEFHAGYSPNWQYSYGNVDWTSPPDPSTPIKVSLPNGSVFRIDPQASGTALILSASIV